MLALVFVAVERLVTFIASYWVVFGTAKARPGSEPVVEAAGLSIRAAVAVQPSKAAAVLTTTASIVVVLLLTPAAGIMAEVEPTIKDIVSLVARFAGHLVVKHMMTASIIAIIAGLEPYSELAITFERIIVMVVMQVAELEPKLEGWKTQE